MFYLTTHSTHFIYGYMVSEKRKEILAITYMHSTVAGCNEPQTVNKSYREDRFFVLRVIPLVRHSVKKQQKYIVNKKT